MDTTEVTLEPENPNNERLPLRMSLSEIESRTASGEMTGGVPDPRRIHQNRPSFERKQDNARDAQITTDPEQWAQAPNRFDFPGVDTGPMFREENPNFDTESFMERIFDL